MRAQTLSWMVRFAVALMLLAGCHGKAPAVGAGELYQQPYLQQYQHRETRDLVSLVSDAARIVRTKGEAGFDELRVSGSRWRRGEAYVFVLDPQGKMLVHPDPTMEGKNELALRDVNGKPIVRGLIAAASAPSAKQGGWYHYEWPVPGEILPRWKSTFVLLVQAPSGKSYVVGSGVYNDRMERSFVIDLVRDAASEMQRDAPATFARLRDPTDRFMAKDAYVFVLDSRGVELVDPGFPNLEGRSLLDMKDTRGKQPIREMLDLARTGGSGWVEYMWPKPGDSVSTQKSAYVMRVNVAGDWLLVGCGVYLADAPRGLPRTTMTAPEATALVREAAAVLEKRGEGAYPMLREKGSKWLRDDTYFFVWTMDGTRVLHAVEPSLEGTNAADARDVRGRPYGRMILDAANGSSGEGWVHYMYPEPGNVFPVWKSTFVKRVTFPSGERRIVGCGVYDMKMDETLIEDVVHRAAALVAERGKSSFDALRDETGPFVFMDTYVFVDTPEGVELVNAGQPSLEGKDVLPLEDAKGKHVAQEYIAKAMRDGRGWVEYTWYVPGQNTLAPKRTFVRRVRAGDGVYIVGSGLYAH